MKLTSEQFAEHYASLPRLAQLPEWRRAQEDPNYSHEERIELWEALRRNPSVQIIPFHPEQYQVMKRSTSRPFSKAESHLYWRTMAEASRRR